MGNDLMTALGKTLRHSAIDAPFDLDMASVVIGARSIERRLDVHSIVDDVRDDLRLAPRLVVTADDSERVRDASALGQERRDDGV